MMQNRMMNFEHIVKIEESTIFEFGKTFIIAEAGVNHNGDVKLAKEMIDVAVEAGVDAVKFQTFKTDELILKNIEKAPYQKITTNSSESQYDMLKRLATDLTNIQFLRQVAKKGKPIILSAGMCYLEEVHKALEAIYPINRQVVLLQCTANYPIQDNEANINVIRTFKEQFNILVGYSDHSEGVGASPYAVAVGAKVIEKHFTLDKTMTGPDQRASVSPKELRRLVTEIRHVESYLGNGIKMPTCSEQMTRKSLQKCFVAAQREYKEDEIILSE